MSLVESPEFELGVDYRADGIALFILQDFGNFTLNLQLQRLEVFKKPFCQGHIQASPRTPLELP